MTQFCSKVQSDKETYIDTYVLIAEGERYKKSEAWIGKEEEISSK